MIIIGNKVNKSNLSVIYIYIVISGVNGFERI